MESKVADATRARQRELESALTPAERVRRALALGRQAIELMAAANGTSVEEARRQAMAVIQAARAAD